MSKKRHSLIAFIDKNVEIKINLLYNYFQGDDLGIIVVMKTITEHF